MKWQIDYSKSAKNFMDEQHLGDKVRELLKNLVLKTCGETINIDLKKLKGEWEGSLRIRKGKIRVIVKMDKEKKNIFVQRIDFRGNVY